MNQFIKTPFLLLVVLITASCSSNQLKPEEYIAFVDNAENGLIKEYTQGDLILTCQYTPNEYTVLKQYDPNNLDAELINQDIENLNDLYQFKLKFENTKQSSFLKNEYTTPDQYNTATMYLSYDIIQDLKLIENNDTVTCNMAHHERTYSNTPYETLLITFPRKSKENNDIQLIFNDRVFGFGRVKFSFDKETLENIPSLKL